MLTSILNTITASIPPAVNVSAATMLLIFIFAVAGMQLYGDAEQCPGNKINDEDNFGDIFHAIMLLYQIATGQDYVSIYSELAHVHKKPLPFAFFAVFNIVAVFVFLNLFVAVLLEKFEREVHPALPATVP